MTYVEREVIRHAAALRRRRPQRGRLRLPGILPGLLLRRRQRANARRGHRKGSARALALNAKQTLADGKRSESNSGRPRLPHRGTGGRAAGSAGDELMSRATQTAATSAIATASTAAADMKTWTRHRGPRVRHTKCS